MRQSSNLAECLTDQGKPKPKAETQSLNPKPKPQFLTDQGKHAEAEEMQREVFAVGMWVLGESRHGPRKEKFLGPRKVRGGRGDAARGACRAEASGGSPSLGHIQTG